MFMLVHGALLKTTPFDLKNVLVNEHASMSC